MRARCIYIQHTSILTRNRLVDGSRDRRLRHPVMGVLVADGEEGLPRRRARDGIHEPVANLLHLVDGRVVVLQVAIRRAAAGAAAHLEALVGEEDEESQRAQIPLVRRLRQDALVRAAREEIRLQQLVAQAESLTTRGRAR